MPDIVLLQMLAEDDAPPSSVAAMCDLSCMITGTCDANLTDHTAPTCAG